MTELDNNSHRVTSACFLSPCDYRNTADGYVQPESFSSLRAVFADNLNKYEPAADVALRTAGSQSDQHRGDAGQLVFVAYRGALSCVHFRGSRFRLQFLTLPNLAALSSFLGSKFFRKFGSLGRAKQRNGFIRLRALVCAPVTAGWRVKQSQAQLKLSPFFQRFATNMRRVAGYLNNLSCLLPDHRAAL